MCWLLSTANTTSSEKSLHFLRRVSRGSTKHTGDFMALLWPMPFLCDCLSLSNFSFLVLDGTPDLIRSWNFLLADQGPSCVCSKSTSSPVVCKPKVVQKTSIAFEITHPTLSECSQTLLMKLKLLTLWVFCSLMVISCFILNPCWCLPPYPVVRCRRLLILRLDYFEAMKHRRCYFVPPSMVHMGTKPSCEGEVILLLVFTLSVDLGSVSLK